MTPLASEQTFLDDPRFLVTNKRLGVKGSGESWEIARISNPRIERKNPPQGIAGVIKRHILSDIDADFGTLSLLLSYGGTTVSPITTRFRCTYTAFEKRLKQHEQSKAIVEKWLHTIDPFVGGSSPEIFEASAILSLAAVGTEEILEWCLNSGDPPTWTSVQVPPSWQKNVHLNIVYFSAVRVQDEYLKKLAAAISAAIATN